MTKDTHMDQAIDYGTPDRYRHAVFYRPRVGHDGLEIVDELCERVPLRVVGETPSLTKYEVAE